MSEHTASTARPPATGCTNYHALPVEGLARAIDWRPSSGRGGLHTTASTCPTCGHIYVYEAVVIGGQWAILREHLTTRELHISPFWDQDTVASWWQDLLHGEAI